MLAEIAADASITAKSVTHIAGHNFWSVPRWIPLIPNDPTSPFLPIDLVLYRQSKRISPNEVIFRKIDECKNLNNYFRSITGGQQASAHFATNMEDKQLCLAISNMYDPCKQGGQITLQQGRLEHVHDDGTLELDNGTIIRTTSDDILLMCTGYRPCLNFFSKQILKELSYKPDDLLSPLILHRCIFHPSLPNLAFIGMYRGAYWGIFELQARWVAEIFVGLRSAPSVGVQEEGLDLERRIRDQDPRPQYPHRDYVGVANDLVKELFDIYPSTSLDFVSPIQFSRDEPDRLVTNEIHQLCEAANQGHFVAGVVFRALHQSRWTFERVIESSTKNVTLHGEAQFDATEQRTQLIYSEKTELITDELFDDLRNLFYIYDEERDMISIHFNKDNGGVGSFFHRICFYQPRSSTKSSSGWSATDEYQSDHQNYFISYLFAFNGICLSNFQVIYKITNSTNDCLITTVFHPK